MFPSPYGAKESKPYPEKPLLRQALKPDFCGIANLPVNKPKFIHRKTKLTPIKALHSNAFVGYNEIINVSAFRLIPQSSHIYKAKINTFALTGKLNRDLRTHHDFIRFGIASLRRNDYSYLVRG